MNRRTAWLAGLAAAAAGASGIGAALWRSRSDAAGIAARIWPMRFATPRGGELVMADLRGHPLLLNFWATWCAPCVSELPMLDRFQQQQRVRGWEVVGLAVDNLEPVVEFLDRRPVGFAIGLAGFGGVELARTLGNDVGALPYTLVLDRAGRVVDRKRGAIRSEDLQRWVTALG